MNLQKHRILTALLVVLIMFFTNHAAAHGLVSLEDDNCVRGMEGSLIHLSAYQPQHDPDSEYCTEIPKEGKTLWVIDLIDKALREMPIDIRIVKGNDYSTDEVVAHYRSNYHPEGVIRGESNLNEGLYTIYVTGESVPPLRYEYPLQVHLDNFLENSHLYILGTLILLLVLAGLFLSKKYSRISHI